MHGQGLLNSKQCNETYVNTPGSDSVNCQPLVSSSTDILNNQGATVAW